MPEVPEPDQGMGNAELAGVFNQRWTGIRRRSNQEFHVAVDVHILGNIRFDKPPPMMEYGIELGQPGFVADGDCGTGVLVAVAAAVRENDFKGNGGVSPGGFEKSGQKPGHGPPAVNKKVGLTKANSECAISL
jgi:hypothetical protein